jgi:hypothetical protein
MNSLLIAERVLRRKTDLSRAVIAGTVARERSQIMKALRMILVAAAAFGSMSGPANAQKPQREATEFFSDETETTTVGWTIIYCDGSHIHTGSYSLYSETFDLSGNCA